MPVSFLASIMNSLLRSFQSSFNKPAVIPLCKVPKNRGLHCCLTASLHEEKLWTPYQKDTQARGQKKQVERAGVDIRNELKLRR